MRVLIVTPQYLPNLGGVETHVFETSKRLVGLGVQIEILTTDRSRRLPRRETIGGIEVTRVPAYPRGRDWLLAPAVTKLVRAAAVDLVHVQSVATGVAPLGMLGALAGKHPYVVSFHTGGHSSAARRRLRSAQWKALGPLLRRARGLLAVSHFEVEMFSSALGLSVDRFRVIRNGAEMPAPDPALPSVYSGKPLLLSVGRLERYKGHHRAIEALEHVRHRLPDAELVIVGGGPYEADLRAMAVQRGLEHSVKFTRFGAEDRVGLATLLHRADMLLLLSDYEAHPVAVMEGLAVGTPVITTYGTGFKELADEGLVSAVEMSASSVDIANLIVERLGTRPPEADLPTWDRCTRQLLEAYEAASHPVRSSHS